MRAVRIERFGDPSGMALADLPEPTAGPAQVVLRTEAMGVGGVDVVIRRGTLGGYGFEPGLVPGSEVAGVVTAVGVGVDQAWLGRRVWAFTGTSGGYVEQAVAAVDDIVALPPALASVDAVTLGSAGPVAHFALRHVHFAPGERILVRGAAGSIGIAAIELAAQAGASVVAVTTSSAERGARLRELGATHVLDRAGAGEGPDGYDVIFDLVGGRELPTFIDLLATNGRLVVVGVIDGFPPADFGLRLLAGFQQSRAIATFSLDTVPRDALRTVRVDQFAAATRGELHAVVDSVLPLEQAADAHRAMDEGSVFGRIVLVP